MRPSRLAFCPHLLFRAFPYLPNSLLQRHHHQILPFCCLTYWCLSSASSCYFLFNDLTPSPPHQLKLACPLFFESYWDENCLIDKRFRSSVSLEPNSKSSAVPLSPPPLRTTDPSRSANQRMFPTSSMANALFEFLLAVFYPQKSFIFIST